jgi:anthranilate synthase/aminodeoxychorismate synthase-like glutamine amidotransferase
MILILDNYDSFTYNLVQLVGRLGGRPAVYRNDEIRVAEIERLAPRRILISPGPGSPLEAGVSGETIRAFAGRVPILGVCLGHQVLAHVYGGRVRRAERPMHGKTSRIAHDGRGWLAGIPSPFEAMRYHSLVVDPESLPPELEVTARSESGEIMGLRHVRHALEGVQFHPESYRTPEGPRVLENFLR